jgi:archaellum component FlaC
MEAINEFKEELKDDLLRLEQNAKDINKTISNMLKKLKERK